MPRRRFDWQYKIAAIQLVLQEGRTVAGVAKELGIHENTLYRWIIEYETRGENAFPGNGSPVAKFEEHKGRYGSKRIVMALKDKNIITNRIRVRKLMVKINLRAMSSCKKYRHYGKNLAYALTDNLLN